MSECQGSHQGQRRRLGSRVPMVAAAVACSAIGLCALALLEPARSVAMSTASAELDAALRLKPNLAHGAELFEMCAACHGQDGHGTTDGSVPAIAGQPVGVIVQQIVEFRYDARLNLRMQHFVDRHHLTAPQELADVAAYVNRLPPRQPEVAEEAPGAGEGPGAMLFGNLCAGCHGTLGKGNGSQRVPRLAGQHAQYLDDQLHDAAEGRRPSMSRDHARVLAALSSDEMEAISRYLAGAGPAEPNGSGTR
jgi:cytochrome c553